MSKELIERLRSGTTGDDGMTSELMAEAADRIDSLDIERATMAHGYRIASQKCVDLEVALAEQRSIAFAAQKEAARLDDLEKSNDRLCERLVIAQKHMTGKQKDAFEAEWREFMDTLRQDATRAAT